MKAISNPAERVSDERCFFASIVLAEAFVNGNAMFEENVLRALETMSSSREFEILGYACYMAMLRGQIARLKNRRALLLSELGELPRPSLQ